MQGTYSTRVADYFGLAHIASGDLVRDEMRRGTDIGKEVSSGQWGLLVLGVELPPAASCRRRLPPLLPLPGREQ